MQCNFFNLCAIELLGQKPKRVSMVLLHDPYKPPNSLSQTCWSLQVWFFFFSKVVHLPIKHKWLMFLPSFFIILSAKGLSNTKFLLILNNNRLLIQYQIVPEDPKHDSNPFTEKIRRLNYFNALHQLAMALFFCRLTEFLSLCNFLFLINGFADAWWWGWPLFKKILIFFFVWFFQVLLVGTAETAPDSVVLGVRVICV